ncbi:hypothetical protein Tco_0035091 [Tanacetum coccineum]
MTEPNAPLWCVEVVWCGGGVALVMKVGMAAADGGDEGDEMMLVVLWRWWRRLLEGWQRRGGRTSAGKWEKEGDGG